MHTLMNGCVPFEISMTFPRPPCSSERGSRPAFLLLVEDEPFVRDATCQVLQSAGFSVLPAANASEAMELYERNAHRVDLLMTDLVLPGRNGRQLGQALRRLSPAIPILLTSGYIEPGCDTESPETGIYYLSKPYSRAELVEKMEQILGRPGLGRAAARSG